MADEYTCAACGGTFEKGWSDDEAAAEAGANFPDYSLDDCAVVCDDCYKAMVPKPLSPEQKLLADWLATTPEWKAMQKAFEDNLLYGTPLPGALQ